MVSSEELLSDAKNRGYAVGAFNITSITYVDAIFDAAQEKNSPVIISVSERHIHKNYISLEATADYIITRSRQCNIPVSLHLDHGESIDMVKKSIDCGFTSVMIDRSNETLEQNISDTCEVVELCRVKKISVEGELGMIGGKEGDGYINIADANFFTSPTAAKEYIDSTHIDALAIAIGNVHGRYLGTPNLDFERLRAIESLVDVPLVLHGGSGISDNDFKKLIHLGIHKINFYSGNVQATYRACEKFMATDPLETGQDVGELFQGIYRAVKETTMHQMDVFGSSGKA